MDSRQGQPKYARITGAEQDGEGKDASGDDKSLKDYMERLVTSLGVQLRADICDDAKWQDYMERLVMSLGVQLRNDIRVEFQSIFKDLKSRDLERPGKLGHSSSRGSECLRDDDHSHGSSRAPSRFGSDKSTVTDRSCAVSTAFRSTPSRRAKDAFTSASLDIAAVIADHIQDDAERTGLDSKRNLIAIPAVEGDSLGKEKNIWPVWHRFEQLVFGSVAEVIVGCLVILNALTIGFEVDYRLRFYGNQVPRFFHTANTVFTSLFTAELVVKMIASGKDFFIGPNMVWHAFDTVLVGSMIIDVLGCTLNVSLLRILRLVRIARLARIIHIFGQLNIIVASVVASVQSLLWSMLLLLMLVYSCSVLLSEILINYKDGLVEKNEENQVSAQLFYWFGGLSRTMLTLFECIASGVSWDEVVHPLYREISPLAGLCLCLFVAFCTFALLNVITGLVLGAATTFSKREEDRAMANAICAALHLSASEIDREIDLVEFEAGSHSAAMKAYLQEVDVSASEAKEVFALIDTDGSGGLTALELVTGLMKLRGTAKAIDVALLFQRANRIQDRVMEHEARIESALTRMHEQLCASTSVSTNSPRRGTAR